MMAWVIKNPKSWSGARDSWLFEQHRIGKWCMFTEDVDDALHFARKRDAVTAARIFGAPPYCVVVRRKVKQ